jgi:rubrerythrin
MSVGCTVHDFLYVGALNVYVDQELLKVLEAWRCRACGAVLAGESRWDRYLRPRD